MSLRRSSEDKSKINSSAPPTSESNNDEQSAKKPDWLAELSRKQANRRSAVFPPASVASSVDQQSDTTSTNNLKSGSTSPPKIQNETKPAVAVDKPHIPLKPSQIREEGTYTIQCVQTSLGYAKCNILKLRKVCERSELHLQKDRIKRFIGSEFKIYPFLLGQYFVNVARFARKLF